MSYNYNIIEIINAPLPFKTPDFQDLEKYNISVNDYNNIITFINKNKLWNAVDELVIENEIGWIRAMLEIHVLCSNNN